MGRTSENVVAKDVVLGDDLQAEGSLFVHCGEVLRHVVTQPAAVVNCAGAVVWLQRGDSRTCRPDLQHLVPDCRHVHWHHHIGTVQALSDSAPELGRPAVFPQVS